MISLSHAEVDRVITANAKLRTDGRVIEPGDRHIGSFTYRDYGRAYDMLAMDPFQLDARWWESGRREGLRVLVSIDDGRFGVRWHLSISHRQRYPVWDEIHAARDAFLPPDLDFMMILPREGFYVNLHKNCFQLHETARGMGNVMSLLPRWLHREYANHAGYFWLPCPLCGRAFGGHEVHSVDAFIPLPDQPGMGQLICNDCHRRRLTQAGLVGGMSK